MSNTVEQKLKSTGSVQQALLLLAREIDNLSAAPTHEDDALVWDDEPVETEQRAKIVHGEGSTEFVIPPPSDETKAIRTKQLDQIGFDNIPPADAGASPEDLKKAYIKGGPVWLYNASPALRELILELPLELRRAMIVDASSVLSNSDLLDMSKDIMMHRGEQNADNTAPLGVSK